MKQPPDDWFPRVEIKLDDVTGNLFFIGREHGKESAFCVFPNAVEDAPSAEAFFRSVSDGMRDLRLHIWNSFKP